MSATDNGHAGPRSSVEKVNEWIDFMCEERLGAAAAVMVKPMINLPEDPAVLDMHLLAYARHCLDLRSDTADPVRLDPDPFTDEPPADTGP